MFYTQYCWIAFTRQSLSLNCHVRGIFFHKRLLAGLRFALHFVMLGCIGSRFNPTYTGVFSTTPEPGDKMSPISSYFRYRYGLQT